MEVQRLDLPLSQSKARCSGSVEDGEPVRAMA